MAFRKNQKVFVIRFDDAYTVVPGIVKRVDDFPSLVFVEVDNEYEGNLTKIVADFKPNKVYKKETDALLAAIEKCHKTGRKYFERADELAKRLKK